MQDFDYGYDLYIDTKEKNVHCRIANISEQQESFEVAQMVADVLGEKVTVHWDEKCQMKVFYTLLKGKN